MAEKADLKVVLLGKEMSGKSFLLRRFLHGTYGVPELTLGAAFGARTLTLANGSRLTLGIWDTAGQERYNSMSRLYYRGSGAAIVCFDLTDNSHLERAQFWIQELKTHVENCHIYLCGTKYDLIEENERKREINPKDVEDLADNIQAPIFETSAKTGHNVEELFHQIAKDFRKSQDILLSLDDDVQGPVILLGHAHAQPKRPCCQKS